MENQALLEKFKAVVAAELADRVGELDHPDCLEESKRLEDIATILYDHEYDLSDIMLMVLKAHYGDAFPPEVDLVIELLNRLE